MLLCNKRLTRASYVIKKGKFDFLRAFVELTTGMVPNPSQRILNIAVPSTTVHADVAFMLLRCIYIGCTDPCRLA